jgi:quercetin dioxygenase-like cupin family protein
MLETHVFADYGVVVQIYSGSTGDELPWHDHPWPHGHYVVSGSTLVWIEGKDFVGRRPGDPNLELPANIPHRIMIAEADTVFVNVQPQKTIEAPPYKNAVLMVDGSVQEA